MTALCVSVSVSVSVCVNNGSVRCDCVCLNGVWSLARPNWSVCLRRESVVFCSAVDVFSYTSHTDLKSDSAIICFVQLTDVKCVLYSRLEICIIEGRAGSASQY